MPRKVTADMTFDAMEEDILFTRAALAADPDAEALLPSTDDWLARVDMVRPVARRAREAAANADAARVVANARLDSECVAFGDQLFLSVGKDRKSTRWRQFFQDLPVSKFVLQALGKQVDRVKGWLGSSDAILEQHRGELSRWSEAAGAAVVKTRAVSVVRAEAWQAREELAEDLTRERDGLHAALGQIAREHGLPRTWPDLFFRVERTARSAESGDEGTDAPPTTPEK